MSRNHDTKYTTVAVVCDTILQSSDTIILDLKLIRAPPDTPTTKSRTKLFASKLEHS